MKVFVPRNIEKGWLKMNFQIGPLNVTLIQLILLAVGMAISLMIWNGMVKGGANKLLAFIVAIPIFIIFIVIAFFKVSEMWLLAYIAKLFRTNVFDTPKKFQSNYDRIDPIEVSIRKSHANDEDRKVLETKKEGDVDKEKLKRLEAGDIV